MHIRAKNIAVFIKIVISGWHWAKLKYCLAVFIILWGYVCLHPHSRAWIYRFLTIYGIEVWNHTSFQMP